MRAVSSSTTVEAQSHSQSVPDPGDMDAAVLLAV